MLKRYLLHDRLLVRFAALAGLVLVAFLVAWTISYMWVPEGILRGRSVAQVLAGGDLAGSSVWLEWLRILAINLGVMLLWVMAPNILRTEGGYPLGYCTVTLIAVVSGVALGSNSLTLSLGGKIAPTMAILEGSGLYEIAAYVLAATATVSISRFRLVGTWPKQTVESVVIPKTRSMIQERTAGLLVAIAVLAMACGWEAYRFSLAVRS